MPAPASSPAAPPPSPAGGRAVRTDSGIPVAPFYDTPASAPDLLPPGTFPYTRGIAPEPPRPHVSGAAWEGGGGSVEAANAHFLALVAAGKTELTLVFDLPTQHGYDADDPRAAGEVGLRGISIATLDEVKLLLAGLPLATLRLRLAANATATPLLVLLQLAAEDAGVGAGTLVGATGGDVLAEYQAGGAYRFPPHPALRLVADALAYSTAMLPGWQPLTVNGFLLREAGCSAVQEIAFALSNGVVYVEAGRAAGLAVDIFAPRLGFAFGVGGDLFEEVAKFRAARRLWATIMRDFFGARSPQSQMLRFHAEPCTSIATGQQSGTETDIVRGAMQTLAALLGGAQSVGDAGDAAQAQILAGESGVAATADPLGGAYYVEYLTNALETEARRLMEQVARGGGAVGATESGYIAGAIAQHACEQAMRQAPGAQVIIGATDAAIAGRVVTASPRPDAASVRAAQERLAAHRAARNAIACESALGVLRGTAAGAGDLLNPMRSCFAAGATLGEVCTVLSDTWGAYIAPRPI